MCLARRICMLCAKLERLKNGLWRIRHWGQFAGVGGLLVLAACGVPAKPLESWIDAKSSKTSDNYTGWRRENVLVGGWTLAALRKGSGVPTHIYIEGDGRAYISRDTVSGDPTPLNPVGLKLALKDPHENVLFVGRSCQWVRGAECRDPKLWTEKRFTEKVAQAYADLVARESQGQPVEVIGFSGGGWVAMQVAARVPNVAKVVTVAGNLMPNWVNEQHRVMRMEVAEYPAFKRELPVTAYVGVDDMVVGSGVVPVFEAETGLKVEVIEVKASHAQGWEEVRLP